MMDESTEQHGDDNDDFELPYARPEDDDFRVIAMEVKRLPFFEDDLFLGMQAINVGIADQFLTIQEYELLRVLFETDRTPAAAHTVSALSQMWVFGVYEVLRLWRDRRYSFAKLLKDGGIASKLKDWPDAQMNETLDIRKEQLTKYGHDEAYRKRIDMTWDCLEPAYRVTESLRMTLAKHSAPGNGNTIARMPGYGRINQWCGSLDYELATNDGSFQMLSRRDVADSMRRSIIACRDF